MSQSDDTEESGSHGDCEDKQCKKCPCARCGAIKYDCVADICIDCRECYKLCECEDRPKPRDRPSQIRKREALLVSCKECKKRYPKNEVFSSSVVVRDKEGNKISSKLSYDNLCGKCRIIEEKRQLSESNKEVTRLQDTLKRTVDEKLLLENEIVLMKRKRDIEDIPYSTESEIDNNGDIKTKVCTNCNKDKPLSSFQSRSSKKNKEGVAVVYVSERTSCNSCCANEPKKKRKKITK